MNKENERDERLDGAGRANQEVPKINMNEVRAVMKRMKSGQAAGPDDIPAETWKCLGEWSTDFLTRLFNKILESEKMPEKWRNSNGANV